eukprot:358162-Chlamydomonas_euryale.AAC.2
MPSPPRPAAAVPPLSLQAVTEGASTHVDAGARRTCLQILERLITDWCGAAAPDATAAGVEPAAAAAATAATSLGSPNGLGALQGLVPAACGAPPRASTSGADAAGVAPPEALPGFCAYAVTAVGGRACVGELLAAGARGAFDVRDAGCAALLGEAAIALKLTHERCGGAALLQHLGGGVLPGTGLPSELTSALLYAVQSGEPKDVKDALRAAFAWLQQAAGSARR